MRIIAGALGGRQFASPHTNRTHPMGDRIRGALFNTLGDIEGLTVLDAFSGTGALAFEAVSRGASQALALESDKAAQAAINGSLHALGLVKQVRLIRANCSSWSDLNTDTRFSLVLCDPPFHDLQATTLAKLTRHLTADGVYVLNFPGKQPAPELPGLEIVSNKHYGDAQLIFYRAPDA